MREMGSRIHQSGDLQVWAHGRILRPLQELFRRGVRTETRGVGGAGAEGVKNSFCGEGVLGRNG